MCEDLTSFTFPLLSATDPLDDAQRRDCAWLTSNWQKKQIRLDRYCSYTHVKSACRLSCNHCEVTDKEGDDVFSLMISNGEEITTSCSWLTRNSNATEKRKSKYCFADDVCETASTVGDSCPVACGFWNGSNEYRQCPSSSPSDVPISKVTSSPTSRPTRSPTTEPTSSVSFRKRNFISVSNIPFFSNPNSNTTSLQKYHQQPLHLQRLFLQLEAFLQ